MPGGQAEAGLLQSQHPHPLPGQPNAFSSLVLYSVSCVSYKSVPFPLSQAVSVFRHQLQPFFSFKSISGPAITPSSTVLATSPLKPSYPFRLFYYSTKQTLFQSYQWVEAATTKLHSHPHTPKPRGTPEYHPKKSVPSSQWVEEATTKTERMLPSPPPHTHHHLDQHQHQQNNYTSSCEHEYSYIYHYTAPPSPRTLPRTQNTPQETD